MKNEKLRDLVREALETADATVLRGALRCLLDLTANCRIVAEQRGELGGAQVWPYQLEWEMARKLGVDVRPLPTPRELREGA